MNLKGMSLDDFVREIVDQGVPVVFPSKGDPGEGHTRTILIFSCPLCGRRTYTPSFSLLPAGPGVRFCVGCFAPPLQGVLVLVGYRCTRVFGSRSTTR